MPLSEIILIIMSLLAIGTILAGLLQKMPIPYTVLLVCIGIFLGEASQYWQLLAPLSEVRLTPEIVLFIFLPTLIFESGLNLNARQLVKDIVPVLALAVPALLFSTIIIGFGMWYLLSIDLIVALLFGALISATDPVAVVALFKELGTSERLTTLVEGESLLNDATAIVMFKILLGIAVIGSFAWSETIDAGFEFIKVFVGGTIIGIGFGMICSWIINHLPFKRDAIILISVVLAYSSFIIAEHILHVSGVMAVVGASLCIGFFVLPGMTHENAHTLDEVWNFLALICNTLLFLLVGLSVNIDSLIHHLPHILIAVLLVLIARGSMIYSLVPVLTRLFHLPRISIGEQHIMWWGGLKGGLAIAIVLSIPETLPGYELLLNVTLGVVIFTLLVNAPSIRPLIKTFGLDNLDADEKAELAQNTIVARNTLDHAMKHLHKANILSKSGVAQIKANYSNLLAHSAIKTPKALKKRQYQLNALQIEKDTLAQLYQMKIIPVYVYMNLKAELMRAKNHLQHPEQQQNMFSGQQLNPFVRFENWMLKNLREKNWATLVLMNYQNKRLSQRLIKNLAQILISDAAMQYLKKEKTIAKTIKKEILAHYQQRMEWFNENIEDIKLNFPYFFSQYETYFSTRTVLMNVEQTLYHRNELGLISSKPLQQLLKQIDQVTTNINLSEMLKIEDCNCLALKKIPLFESLSEHLLTTIALQMHKMYFLTEDIIIAEGEKGDAVYFILSGEVSISKEDQHLANLSSGEFFGEMALYNESKRTATVQAQQAVSLLRLNRENLEKLAAQHPDIQMALDQARNLREQSNINP